MPADKFSSSSDSLIGPARQVFAVVPDDTNALPQLPKSLLIGGGGTLTLRAVDSAADVTIAVAAGQQLDIRASFVRATGTSATGIVGLG